MTDPDVANQVGAQLALDAEGHIIGLAPPPPPVPDLTVADDGGDSPAPPPSDGTDGSVNRQGEE